MDIDNGISKKKIDVDIDKDHIKAIVDECITMINEYNGSQDFINREKALNTLGKILDSNMVSVEFYIPLPNIKIPDLILRVEPRSKSLLLRSKFKKKVNELNHFARAL